MGPEYLPASMFHPVHIVSSLDTNDEHVNNEDLARIYIRPYKSTGSQIIIHSRPIV
ncbi:hypothetical protein Mapa_004696 [Marchantia paleacea]|nr:hypothetical protein Mapa_004696 [Marchantia paleacea]